MADQEELFNLSYWRATENVVAGAGFPEAFLGQLARVSPDLPLPKTDDGREELRTELMLILLHLAAFRDDEAPDGFLGAIVRRHRSDGHSVERYFDGFLEALLATVAQFDPRFDAEIADAWKSMLRPGLEHARRLL